MTESQKTVTGCSEIVLHDPLHFELLPNGRSARLIKDYKVSLVGILTITAPAGFETDFASVPRLFWRIVPPWGRYSPAAVVHDFLYHTGLVTRAEADRIFLGHFIRTKVALHANNRRQQERIYLVIAGTDHNIVLVFNRVQHSADPMIVIKQHDQYKQKKHGVHTLFSKYAHGETFLFQKASTWRSVSSRMPLLSMT